MAQRTVFGDDPRQESWVQDLKVVRDGSNNNKILLRSNSLDSQPDAYNPIKMSIPTGNGIEQRKRGAAYLSGAFSITMVDGTGYWGLPSLDGSKFWAFLYAIWDGTGVVFALGGHPDLSTVSTTTTVTDADYLLLEDSSTYSRNSSHYCTCCGMIEYEYDTADTPDYTFNGSSFRLIPGERPWQGGTVFEYYAVTTAGEEMLIRATGKGVSVTRASNVYSFSVPAGVKILFIQMRIPGAVPITGSIIIDLNDGATGWGNRRLPSFRGWREDTGVTLGNTCTADTTNFDRFTISALGSAYSNTLVMAF